MSRKWESNVLGSVGRIGQKKLFMNSSYIMSRKWESIVFGLNRPK